jgi:hypothetical protein
VVAVVVMAALTAMTAVAALIAVTSVTVDFACVASSFSPNTIFCVHCRLELHTAAPCIFMA